MEALHGIDGVLFFKKNEEWVVFGCCENVECVVNTETVSVKTIGDGMWDTHRAQKHAYTVSCSGIVQYDDEDNRVNHFDLLEYQVQGVHIEWYISFKQNDKTTEYTQLRGQALVVNTNIAAPNDFVNSSVELKGKGNLLRGAPPTCDAEIPDVEGDSWTLEREALGFIYHMAVLEVSTGSVPAYDWRLDGGAMNTALSSGWSFSSGGYGSHVLEIWPRCDNGVQGVKLTINFETTL